MTAIASIADLHHFCYSASSFFPGHAPHSFVLYYFESMSKHTGNILKLSPDRLVKLLSNDAGLKAIAGTGNVQELLSNEHTYPLAAKAIGMFIHCAGKNIGALSAAPGGLDILIFTGGIGENPVIIRDRICTDLDFSGISVDPRLNQMNHKAISSKSSGVKVLVLRIDEEQMIARHTKDIIDNINQPAI